MLSSRYTFYQTAAQDILGNCNKNGWKFHPRFATAYQRMPGRSATSTTTTFARPWSRLRSRQRSPHRWAHGSATLCLLCRGSYSWMVPRFSDTPMPLRGKLVQLIDTLSRAAYTALHRRSDADLGRNSIQRCSRRLECEACIASSTERPFQILPVLRYRKNLYFPRSQSLRKLVLSLDVGSMSLIGSYCFKATPQSEFRPRRSLICAALCRLSL